MKKEYKENTSTIRNFETEDYHKNNDVSKGLATTHEQVSDSYMSGEIVPSKYERTLPRNTAKKPQ